MDEAMSTVFFPAGIEIVKFADECEEDSFLDPHQTVITTVEEVNWTTSLTLDASVVAEPYETKSNEDEDSSSENHILINEEEPLTLPVEEDGTTQYVIVDDELTIDDGKKPSFLYFEDGTVGCIDPVVFLETDDEVDTDSVVAIRRSGKKPKTHVCQYDGCGRTYSSLHHLKVHARSHTGDRPYKCPHEGCAKEFNTDYSRKAHVRTHTGEKPYICSVESCGKGFKTSGDLVKHTRTHTGERPFICPLEFCEKSFATSTACKVHIRTHTGEKPYLCLAEGCDRGFSSPTNFKNHMRVHTGERPYACQVPGCEKKFTEYSSLYKHRLVHSQAKRFQCGFCTKIYRQMSSLNTHKRTVHGVVLSEDGTEVLLEQMIGNGPEGVTDFKSVTSDLMCLKKVSSLTFEDEGSPLYEFSETESEVR